MGVHQHRRNGLKAHFIEKKIKSIEERMGLLLRRVRPSALWDYVWGLYGCGGKIFRYDATEIRKEPEEKKEWLYECNRLKSETTDAQYKQIGEEYEKSKDYNN